ncbi:uncharacterized protein LOC111712425, partial [Eurytemora carolleeae]|uniref:uncharacterized protein LOC111712425 n=1 Tax=Eurytemora carolleeae TaxID=1294199 RepID=UPI000C77C611
MQFFIFILLSVAAMVQVGGSPAITGLSADSGFRNLTLHWNLENSGGEPTLFKTRYCENQFWGEHHCRKTVVSVLPKEGKFIHQIQGLKMATEYVIYLSLLTKVKSTRQALSVLAKEKEEEEDEIEDLKFASKLNVETKGFSAQARDCGPKHTQVEIQTGPGFTGKISAEGSLDPSCSLQGAGGEQLSYTLDLNHKKCRSELNSTVAWTYIVVQENLPILTHSTRRFLILCKFAIPDVFTVQSGLNLPFSSNI